MRKFLSIILVIASLISCNILVFADDDSSSGSTIIVIEDTEDITEEPAESPEATEEPEATATPSPTPEALYPVITKNPTNENIYTGDSAVFIARADNADSITWYLISPDGSTTFLASSADSLFPGVVVSGANSEKLVLSNVNTKLSGYKAYARFLSSEGYFADSTTATVTVSPLASPTPTVTPTATPTSSPVPSATPAVTPQPTSVPSPSPLITSSPDNLDVSRESNRVSGGVSFATVFLLILSIAVIAGAAVVLSLYVRGSIDLSWLEDILTRVKKSDSKSDDDIPEQFYNPDDYKEDK